MNTVTPAEMTAYMFLFLVIGLAVGYFYGRQDEAFDQVRKDKTMKREILCESCAKSARAMFPNNDPYPGEHIKFVVGLAMNPYRCDHCNKEIPVNRTCVAFTIWMDRKESQYRPWEGGYIKVV